MSANPIAALVATARRLAATGLAPADLAAALAEPVRACALADGWVTEALLAFDEDQGFGSHLLHQEADHGLALIAVAWGPGRGAPPHDHGTWGVVCGVRGAETNTGWRRLDDGGTPGTAIIEPAGRSVIGRGDVVTLLAGDIHSVVNETGAVSLSLHLYGRHLNYTGRRRYDPAARTESPFVVRVRPG